MSFNSANLDNIFLGLIIIVWLIRRQLTPRVLEFKAHLYFVMITFGLYETFKIKPLDINSNFYLFLLLSSLLVIIFGILRAYTTHFWINDDGLIMRQGNYVTLILWITAIVLHAFINRLWDDSAVTTLIYLGATLLIQRGVSWHIATVKYPNNIVLTQKFNEDKKRKK